jgi:histone H3
MLSLSNKQIIDTSNIEIEYSDVNEGDLLIRKLVFQRLAREIAKNCNDNIKIPNNLLSTIQQHTEKYIIDLFKNSNTSANHSNRITITMKDIQLANRICKNK